MDPKVYMGRVAQWQGKVEEGSIRRKLGLVNKKINLYKYLQSFPSKH